MHFSKISLVVVSIFLVFNFGCKNDPPPPPPPSPKTVKIPVPKFDRDSAFYFVKKQVDFGPRLPNTEGHIKAKKWLVNKLKTYNLTVIEQNFEATEYTGTILKSTNIIAQYNPAAPKRIMLAAHWDTRHIADSPASKERRDEPILGADDSGSGVGILLEIARQLKSTPADLGVDIVLFDSEDHGDSESENPEAESWCLGSQYWSKNIVPPGYRPKYGILLDMVGARNTSFPKDGVSMAYAPQVVDKVWKLGQSLGYERFFSDKKVGNITDDHYFVNTIAGIPMIDIIGMPQTPGAPTSFGAHWHTHDDNMEIIDARTLKAVGQTLLAVIYNEAAGRF